VLGEAEKADRLDVFGIADGKHIAGWRPYGKEDEKNRKVTFAALLTSPTAKAEGEATAVLTNNAANQLILWSLPGCKAEYVSQVANLSHFRLTADGKYLVGLEGDRLRCYETATGQAAADTATAPPTGASRG